MAEIKNIAQIREKYARVTPGRAEDYASGVAAPRKDWAKVTALAEPAYQAGVTAAISRKAFGRGVNQAGTQKWQGRSLTVGAERWGPGVTAAVDSYERGFAPYRATIEKLSLPARFPVGDARNYARVQAVGEALRKAKVGASGS